MAARATTARKTASKAAPKAKAAATPPQAAAPKPVDTAALLERLANEQAELSDAELGVGEDDAAEVDLDRGADPLAALLADPKAGSRLAELIDAAVEARMAKLAPVAAIPGLGAGEGSEAFKAFLATIEKMLELNAIQQPGYTKPIPPAEMERRAEGYVEMTALLRSFREQNRPPHYYVGASLFYTDCELIEEGEPIATYLPPVEDFDPINDEARQVMAAFRRWIGGATPGIGDQIASAMAERRAGPRLVGEGLKDPKAGATTRLADVKRREVVRPPAFPQQETVMPAGHASRDARTEAAEPRVGPQFA